MVQSEGDTGAAGLALTPELAAQVARLALGGVRREYPNKLDHVLLGPEDVRTPRELHPAFYGCFDWHSAVHGHWALARVLRRFPQAAEAAAIRAVLDEHLTAARIAGEVAYFSHPAHGHAESTYGWAWLLKLAAELHGWEEAEARGWRPALAPLAELLAARLGEFLARLGYPIRHGVHGNTAFSLDLALEYARSTGDATLASLLVQRARGCFLADRDGPAASEPGGEDFLSPCLEEAALMARVLPSAEFRPWLAGFLPDLERSGVLTPAQVSDRADPKIVHLDGLNLSRARALRVLAATLGAGDPLAPCLEQAAQHHAEAALPHLASGHYGGEHWLGTFALRMLAPEA